MAKASSWKIMEDKFRAKLSKWKTPLLSIGGRSVLISSVLGAIGIYYFSIFLVPAKVLKTLEQIRANFFWGDSEDNQKIHWVAWKRILASKDNGGLGLGSLEAFNLSLLQKWRWRLVNEPQSLWSRIIFSIHGNKVGIRDVNGPIRGNGVWIRCLKSFSKLNEREIVPFSSLSLKVGNGDKTSFWLDIWIEDVPLAQKFPRLFALEVFKECLVSQKMGVNSWSWRRPIRSGEEHSQFICLLSLLDQIRLQNEPDRWVWSLDGSHEFVVKDVRKTIDEYLLPSELQPTRWNKFIPRKVNICVWRVLINRLPTRANLDAKGMDVSSILCPFCDSDSETVVHLFGHCSKVSLLWLKISAWLDISVPIGIAPATLIEWIDDSHFPNKKKELIEAVFFVSWWVIWKLRNEIIFGKDSNWKVSAFDDIMHFSFLWFVNRNNKCILNWNEWLKNPLLCL